MTGIDDILKAAVDQGYIVSFICDMLDGKYSVTYKLRLPDGCSYGRGVVLDNGFFFKACLIRLCDSIEETMRRIPKLEKKNQEHGCKEMKRPFLG